ncbi:MAG TPA: glycosyltransferase family 39 protein [Candidatus Dormibacteraeota bacterium]|nr:glycosyltransferase family 39 protein [Candidatus Dormibacteraeota bacterium]
MQPPRRRWNAHTCALVLVMALGAALRFYDIAGVPSELIADELKHYDNAQSIVTTGRDIDGRLLPFFYSSFTRHPPMYAVVGYASTLIFGRNAFGLRFPAAAFGLIAILLMYAIAFELTRRRDVALITALLQATQPIFVHFSRIAWEPATELPFLLAGLYVLVRTFRRADDGGDAELTFARFALAALLLALTCYTYMAAWFYAIVLAGAILALNAKRLRSRRVLPRIAGATAVWAALAAPAFWMLFWNASTADRTQRMATFAHGVSLPALATFVANYAAQFRWSYLVTTGDPQTGTTWRYLVGFGAFYWWVVPLAILGVLCARAYVTQPWARGWLWVWLLAYPLGGALTTDGIPNAPRTLAGAPVFCVLAAIGFAWLTDAAKAHEPSNRKGLAVPALRGLLGLNVAISVLLFSLYYFTQYIHVYPNAWDSGTRATFAFIRAHEHRYRRVCISIYPAWYALDTYVRYYLAGSPLTTIENVDSSACFLPGTLLVTDDDHRVSRRAFTPLAVVRDVNGAVFAVISGRPLNASARTRSSTSIPTGPPAPTRR